MGGRPPDGSTQDVHDRLLYVAEFGAEHFADVRREVDTAARQCGLPADKTIDFVTAVNEVMTNAVRHGGGRGELRLWDGDGLTCEVRDHGPGFTVSDYLDRHDRPAPSAGGGMGLWIIQQTSEALSINSGPSGTTVRISAVLSAVGPNAPSSAASSS